MIQALSITKSYGHLQVLKGVNISVAPGEVVSIVGKSGAGKSTLLHIAGTLDKPDNGNLRINGEDVLNMPQKQLSDFRNRHIGFIFQFHHLLPEFTALENVLIPARIAGGNISQAESKAKNILELLGVSARIHHKPSELSGGEAQRVAVARALINSPSVIMADEPSGNLDTQSSKDLHELFFVLRNEFKQTFLIVTHNEELAGMADRKIIMSDGNIISEEKKASL